MVFFSSIAELGSLGVGNLGDILKGAVIFCEIFSILNLIIVVLLAYLFSPCSKAQLADLISCTVKKKKLKRYFFAKCHLLLMGDRNC